MVYLATRPVDFRKGHDGLSALVRDMFGLNPFSGAVFVFSRSGRTESRSGLGSDRAGVAHKRLEGGKFVGPGCATASCACRPHSSRRCRRLDWRLVRPERARRPVSVINVQRHERRQYGKSLPRRPSRHSEATTPIVIFCQRVAPCRRAIRRRRRRARDSRAAIRAFSASPERCRRQSVRQALRAAPHSFHLRR